MAGNGPAGAASGARRRDDVSYGWLKKRSDFLNAAKGGRAHHFAFALQSAKNPSTIANASGDVRFGLTVSKRNGNAVVRNRIKRRLRAALAQASSPAGGGGYSGAGQSGSETRMQVPRSETPRMDVLAGHDYVIVARPAALRAPFGKLVDGLRKTAAKIHSGRKSEPAGHKRGSGTRNSPVRSTTAANR